MKMPQILKDNKNKLAISGLVLIMLPFLFLGVAQAYDTLVLTSLENALKSSIDNMHSSKATCEASYLALRTLKEQNNIILKSTTNPCTF